jgi:hypothetical protein
MFRMDIGGIIDAEMTGTMTGKMIRYCLKPLIYKTFGGKWGNT